MQRAELALGAAAAVAQYAWLTSQGDGELAREVALDFICVALAAGIAEGRLYDLCVRVLADGETGRAGRAREDGNSALWEVKGGYHKDYRQEIPAGRG